ncbi:AI-2E family transporter [uncultured Lactobacillus sp.]|uniref:AI-2E family transporter n=1 Tax=uncultured Lactobacillus sp. TaxID=153152 RepID=UPI0026244B53|nr:AI-2E family transporter [uncultured Lactobacillus sp.]
MENNQHRGGTILKKWFLDNRFSIVLLNILLFFLVIWIFNKVSFMLNPAWVFFSAILPPLLVAVIQYYVMNPVVDWCERKFKIPRVVTILALFIIVIVALIWIINILVPIAQNQVNSLIKNWPHIWNDAVNATQSALRDPRLSAFKGSIKGMINDTQRTLFKSGQNTINATIGNISSAVSIITMVAMTLLTAPFILFFMLKDGHQLRPYITRFAPERWQASFSKLLYDINYAVASYVRGQITVAFWVGVMFSLGYILIGLPYGLALAILAGVMNLIPYFGTPIAMIPVVVISIMTSGSMLIKVLIVFAIEQTIESRILSPWVMGSKMEMHPITTILLLIGASAVWGLWGVIFGIPIYAILKIIVSRVYNYYRRESKLFEEDTVSSTTGDADHDETNK